MKRTLLALFAVFAVSVSAQSKEICLDERLALEDEFDQLYVKLKIRFEEVVHDLKRNWTIQQIQRFNELCANPVPKNVFSVPYEETRAYMLRTRQELLSLLQTSPVIKSKEAFERELRSRGEFLLLSAEHDSVQMVFNLHHGVSKRGTLLVNVKNSLCGKPERSKIVFSLKPLLFETEPEFLRAMEKETTLSEEAAFADFQFLSRRDLILRHLPVRCQTPLELHKLNPYLAGQPFEKGSPR